MMTQLPYRLPFRMCSPCCGSLFDAPLRPGQTVICECGQWSATLEAEPTE